MNMLKVVGYIVGFDAVLTKSINQVHEATWVLVAVFLLVDNFERLRTAWGVEEIVPSDRVASDSEHRRAAIGIEDVTGGKINRISVIKAAARREPFPRVRCIESDEI